MDTDQRSFSQQCLKSRLPCITYLCQIAGIFAVITTCLINLSIARDNLALWSSLLSGSLGYLLPSPKFKPASNSNEPFLPNPPLEQFGEILPGQHDDQLLDSPSIADRPNGRLGDGPR
jgi:hypothetical protein